ncbi:macro domain-like protein [Periconia macrospinosa]|uniref:Macro domain-like protein n=1 Tax=Periconia macrospinosa TaxID=97972 RepID=A0A2V1DYF6_9PLEO|nr:macro domain-like protein [Periconia macrospinosa]
MSSTSSPSPAIPQITILITDPDYATAFTTAAKTHSLPPSLQITTTHNLLSTLPANTSFDAIVSPANSYGLMDGGFDDALSRAFSPRTDYGALTRVAKRAIYDSHFGFLPPGACAIADLEDARGKEGELKENPWGCRYLVVLPTMKIPQDVTWDREVVYECVWTMCAAVERHNRRVREEEDGGREIGSLLMTPLATGYGKVSKEKWAFVWFGGCCSRVRAVVIQMFFF